MTPFVMRLGKAFITTTGIILVVGGRKLWSGDHRQLAKRWL